MALRNPTLVQRTNTLVTTPTMSLQKSDTAPEDEHIDDDADKGIPKSDTGPAGTDADSDADEDIPKSDTDPKVLCTEATAKYVDVDNGRHHETQLVQALEHYGSLLVELAEIADTKKCFLIYQGNNMEEANEKLARVLPFFDGWQRVCDVFSINAVSMQRSHILFFFVFLYYINLIPPP